MICFRFLYLVCTRFATKLSRSGTYRGTASMGYPYVPPCWLGEEVFVTGDLQGKKEVRGFVGGKIMIFYWKVKE